MTRYFRKRYAILFILFAGYTLRLLLHRYHGLEGDDAFSLALSRYPIGELVSGLMHLELDIHPPLHFIVLKSWVILAGESLLSLRLLNILLDTLTGALLVRLLLAPVNETHAAPLIGISLWTVSPLLIFGGWLVRMYTLLGFMVMVGAVCALQATKSKHHFWTWSLYAVLATLAALYTHITGVIVYGMVGWVLLRGAWQRSRLYITGVVGLMLLVGVLYLPFAIPIARLYTSGTSLGASVNPANALSPLQIPGAIWLTTVAHRSPFMPLWGLLAFIPMIGLFRSAANRKLPLLHITLIAYVGLVVLGMGAGLYKPRYIVPFAPLLLAYAAISLSDIRRATQRNIYTFLRAGIPIIVTVVIAGLSINGIVQNLQRNWRDDWTAATAFVTSHSLTDDAVLVVPDWGEAAFHHHYTGDMSVRGFFPQISPDLAFGSAFDEYAQGYDRVWLVRYQPEVSDSNARTTAWFNERAAFATSIFPAGMEISLFDQNPIHRDLPPSVREIDVSFGEVLALRGVLLPLSQTEIVNSRLYGDSGRVLVTLYWEALQHNIIETPRVRLTDPYGQVYGGTLKHANRVEARYPVASWQPGQIITTYYDLNINPATLPGMYNIEVMVLDDSGTSLAATGKDSGDFWAIAGQVQLR